MFKNFQVYLRKVSTLKTLQMHSNDNSSLASSKPKRGRLLEIGGATWRLSLEARRRAWRSFVFYMSNSLEWHLYWLLYCVLHLSLYHFVCASSCISKKKGSKVRKSIQCLKLSILIYYKLIIIDYISVCSLQRSFSYQFNRLQGNHNRLYNSDETKIGFSGVSALIDY